MASTFVVLYIKESEIEERLMKILLLGYSGSGKSTAAELLAKILNTSYANTSDVIIQDFARANKIPILDVVNNKEAYREKIWRFGREKQAKDPLYPQRQQIEKVDIITGVRNRNEVVAARRYGLYDAIIWIDRDSCKRNLTDNLSKNDANYVVDNNGTILELEEKLLQLIGTLPYS